MFSMSQIPSPVRGCSAYLLPPFLWLWVLEDWSLALPDKYLCSACIQNHVLVGDSCWGTGTFFAPVLMCIPEPCCHMQGWKLTAQLPFFKLLFQGSNRKVWCLSLCNAELCWIASALIWSKIMYCCQLSFILRNTSVYELYKQNHRYLAAVPGSCLFWAYWVFH